MFSKRQVDSNKLPLTVFALKEKVSRAHYISNPSFPNPNDNDCCFNQNTEVHKPIMTQLAPAPEPILHLTVCSCGIKHTTNRCKCYKNGFNCSEICGWENCKNDYQYDEVL